MVVWLTAIVPKNIGQCSISRANTQTREKKTIAGPFSSCDHFPQFNFVYCNSNYWLAFNGKLLFFSYFLSSWDERVKKIAYVNIQSAQLNEIKVIIKTLILSLFGSSSRSLHILLMAKIKRLKLVNPMIMELDK